MTFMVVSTIGLVVTVNLRFLYYSIALFIVMIMSASFFMPTARSLKRLEAVCK